MVMVVVVAAGGRKVVMVVWARHAVGVERVGGDVAADSDAAGNAKATDAPATANNTDAAPTANATDARAASGGDPFAVPQAGLSDEPPEA